MKAWIWKMLLWAWITFLFLWVMGTYQIQVAYARSQATSGVTAQDLIDEVRNDLTEESASFYSDSDDFVPWLDEAVRIVASLTECIEEEEDVVLAVDTVYYSLSTSYYDIKPIALYDSGVDESPYRYSFVQRIEQGTLPQQAEDDERPKTFWVWKDKIGVYPVPSEDWVSGTTVTVYLSAKPSGVTNTSSQIETPWYYDEAIKTYVQAKAMYKKGWVNRYQALIQEFYSMLGLHQKQQAKEE